MILSDILSITRQGTEIYIINDGNIIAWYDVKQSIDLKFNNCNVISQRIACNVLCIEIEI